MGTAQKAVKAVGLIVIIGFVSKILGFLRELVTANYYGAGGAMDAFGIANVIPGILLAGLATAITIVFIPAFIKRSEETGPSEALAYSQKIFTAFFLAGTSFSILAILFADPLIAMIAPGFSPEKLRLTVNLTRILLLSGAFVLLNGLCTGLLQARENFLIPALIAFPMNIVVILSIVFLQPSCGIYALAIGTALSVLSQVILQIPSVKRTGFSFKPAIDFSDPELKRLVWMVFPVFAGTMLLQVNTVMNRFFATGLPEGTISALNYTNRITGILVGMVGVAVATVALPILSKAAANNDLPRLRSMMLYSVRGTNALIIPMTVGIVVLRIPLVRLLFQRGAFDAKATSVTALALLYLSLGLFAYSMIDIFCRVFYSLDDTVTPMINSGVTIAVNIILILVLTPRYGLSGLAGAASISGVFGCMQLVILLKRKIGRINGKEMTVSFLKISTASLLMGVLIWLAYSPVRNFFPGPGFFPQLMALTLVTGIGVIIYLGGLLLLRSKETEILLDLVKWRS